MAFTDDITSVVSPIWASILEHPMVEQLGQGTLDEAPFRYWVKQDYVYLIEYNRVFSMAVTKAPDLKNMSSFADLLHETLHTEMDLHRAYASDFGISREELENTAPSPTTRGYTDFLVRTSSLGTFGDIVAVVLPCMWGFNETGKKLRKRGLPDDSRCSKWIEMYSGEEFTELANWCREMMDEVARDRPEDDLVRYREIIRTSARYEYMFWDAAWNQERWPV